VSAMQARRVDVAERIGDLSAHLAVTSAVILSPDTPLPDVLERLKDAFALVEGLTEETETLCGL